MLRRPRNEDRKRPGGSCRAARIRFLFFYFPSGPRVTWTKSAGRTHFQESRPDLLRCDFPVPPCRPDRLVQRQILL